MCTGDNLDTATAISKNAGIVKPEEVNDKSCMTGKQFREAVGGLKQIQDPKNHDDPNKLIDQVTDMHEFIKIKR